MGATGTTIFRPIFDSRNVAPLSGLVGAVSAQAIEDRPGLRNRYGWPGKRLSHAQMFMLGSTFRVHHRD